MNLHVMISQIFASSLYSMRKSKTNYYSAVLLQYYVTAQQILPLVKKSIHILFPGPDTLKKESVFSSQDLHS